MLGSVLASVLAGVVLLATDGPLTPLMNLRARTDENGYLRVSGGSPGSTDGPLTPMANLRGRTNESGYLRVAFAGSQTLAGHLLFSPDNTYDIGANGATRPRTIYAGTSVFAGNLGMTTAGLDASPTGAVYWASRAKMFSPADSQVTFRNDAATTTVTLTVPTGTGNLVPIVVASAGVTGATGVTASIATFTVGAADATFEVGCNVLVTTATTHSFSCDVTYTDEGNSARTMVLPVVQLAGTFVTTGLITNVTGAGPYESPAMNIRAKASTAITVRTSAGGTYTTVVYNARGVIKQVS
jgi:hypothetical protein